MLGGWTKGCKNQNTEVDFLTLNFFEVDQGLCSGELHHSLLIVSSHFCPSLLALSWLLLLRPERTYVLDRISYHKCLKNFYSEKRSDGCSEVLSSR